MKNKQRATALAVLLLLSGTSYADNLRVTWRNPTTYVDGSLIPEGAITQTRIEYGTCVGYNEFGEVLGNRIKAGESQYVIVSNLVPGQEYCFRGYTTTTTESGPSNVVSMTIPISVPSPPTLNLF